jgi:antitoxin component YwqK of YwqJK toxin-antitoxin module
MPKKQPAKSGATKSDKPTEHVTYHKDGSVWARGKTLNGQMVGHWEWFRKDGSKLRSGSFDNGIQVGEWTTYDRNGAVYKVTTIKPRAAR